MARNATYWESNFDEVEDGIDPAYGVKVKFSSDGGDTKWLNLTVEQWTEIKAFMLSIENTD